MAKISAVQLQLISTFPVINLTLKWARQAMQFAITGSPGDRKIIARVLKAATTMLREYQPGGFAAPEDELEILAQLHLATIIEHVEMCANSVAFYANASNNTQATSILSDDGLEALQLIEQYDPAIGTVPVGLDVKKTTLRMYQGSIFSI